MRVHLKKIVRSQIFKLTFKKVIKALNSVYLSENCKQIPQQSCISKFRCLVSKSKLFNLGWHCHKHLLTAWLKGIDITWIFSSFLVLFKLYHTFDDLSLSGVTRHNQAKIYLFWLLCLYTNFVAWCTEITVRKLFSFPNYVALSRTIYFLAFI